MRFPRSITFESMLLRAILLASEEDLVPPQTDEEMDAWQDKMHERFSIERYAELLEARDRIAKADAALKTKECPFCGTGPEHHISDHGDETFMPRWGCLKCNKWWSSPCFWNG